MDVTPLESVDASRSRIMKMRTSAATLAKDSFKEIIPCLRRKLSFSRTFIIAGFLLALLPWTARAIDGPPGPGGGSSWPTPLDSWTFYDNSNWTDVYGDAPISFTNLSWSPLGDGASLVVETNVLAWLDYEIYQTNVGATNLVANGPGSITFWYGPGWATTNGGPGDWSQLINVGEWTSNSSYGYWGLSIDAAGSNIWFSSQDGAGDSYRLSAPISWTTNYFHFIALSYSSTNVTLYLDGQLATNDPGGLSIWPGTNALSGGVYFGSDTNGSYQANGLFNLVQTYNTPLDSNTVQGLFGSQIIWYEISPWNIPYMSSAQANENSYDFTNSTIPDVITGAGDLQWDGIAANCVYNANPYYVWITNVIATPTNNGAMNVTFSIDGGQAGYMYDVFATSALQNPLPNATWAWMGQGAACNTYTLTNITTTAADPVFGSTAAFLILGTPEDSDGDGLTDAYELLVSHSNPTNYSTDGTGMADGWEVLYFGHTGIDPNGDPDGDGLTTFQEWQMRSQGYDPAQWDSSTNSVVGDGYQNYSGDGLANLMHASFGGNMFTNNPTWKVNVAGDGFPDEYKTLVGLSTNSVVPVPGLPAYSMNPIP